MLLGSNPKTRRMEEGINSKCINCGVSVISTENGHSDPSSNPGRGCLPFT